MHFTRYQRTLLSILLTLICIYLFGQLRGFFNDIWGLLATVLFPFLAALVLSYIFQPVVELLARRHVPRGIAVLVIYVVIIVIIVVAILNAIPVLTAQFTQLTQNLPNLIQQGNAWLDGLLTKRQYLPDSVRLGLENAINQSEKSITGGMANIFLVISNTLSTIFAAFVIPFLVFYMLKDARAIGRAVVRLSPPKRRDSVRELLASVDETLGRYIRGQLLVMLSVGILTYVGYLIVGMPYALVLALFLATADMVPYLGPFIGAMPALLLALPLGFGMALKVLIVNVIVQQLEGNLISPQIMGRTLSLHPMAIVAALLIGGELAGVVGLIAAVPVLAVGKVVVGHLFGNETGPRS